METTEITVYENGPLGVKGPITVNDADGNAYDISEMKMVLLCRCGQSSNKPFCDSTHRRNGFEATERAS